MSGKTAAIIGATGMIGQYLTGILAKDPYFETVRLLVRKPMPKPDNEKVEVKLVDFNDHESLQLALEGVDMIFSAIGTTQKKVKGNKDLYRKIDFDIPIRVAKICKENGCEKFLLVSSVGADSKSSTFYLKLKGEVEDALIATGLESIHIFQPSMLLGDRPDERSGESILQNSMKFISPILPKKYKAIHGNKLSQAMVNISKKDGRGVFRYTYKEIINYSM